MAAYPKESGQARESRQERAIASWPAGLEAQSRLGFPRLLALSDEARSGDPLSLAWHLPKGVGLLFRHYGAEDRASLARACAVICRSRGRALLIAGDAALAHAVGATGVHWPAHELAKGRPADRIRRHADFIVTAAVHSECALRHAERLGVDAVLLSPVFATASHPGAAPLGLRRFAALAASTDLPVYALGGITPQNARAVCAAGAYGIAAVGAFRAQD